MSKSQKIIHVRDSIRSHGLRLVFTGAELDFNQEKTSRYKKFIENHSELERELLEKKDREGIWELQILFAIEEEQERQRKTCVYSEVGFVDKGWLYPRTISGLICLYDFHWITKDSKVLDKTCTPFGNEKNCCLYYKRRVPSAVEELKKMYHYDDFFGHTFEEIQR